MVAGLSAEVEALADRSPRELRALIRRGEWTRGSVGLALGYTQANLTILPVEYAFEFLLFCQRNPKPCPILEVTDAGSSEPRQLAPGADLRTDLTKYRIYEHGKLVAERTDVVDLWRSDSVAFFTGCALTFFGALLRASIPVRKSGMYVSNVPCAPAGRLSGPLVVSARAIPQDKVVRAVQVTSRFVNTHGAPIHIGDPAALGIDDLSSPYHGQAPQREPGDVLAFWACGLTIQAVAMTSRIPFMITSGPSDMFVTDRRDEEMAAL